jgi:hypothetical protein
MFSKLTFLLITLYVTATVAFVAPSTKSSNIAFVTSTPVTFGTVSDSTSNTVLQMADSYWEGEYPPSSVLGPIMSKMPSGTLGLMSLIFLAICAGSIGGSQILVNEPGAFESGSWVKWYYVLGSFMGPISWGTHVACWIQRKNGM